MVSDVNERKEELEHIRGALKLNNYLNWTLPADLCDSGPVNNTEPKTITPSDVSKQKNRKFSVVLPYIRGVSEQLRRVIGGFGVPAYFKPTNTLRQLLVRPKDPISKHQVVGPVYKINCEDCDAAYVGEMERSLKVKFGEHSRPSSTNSEVSHHIHLENPDHPIKLDNTDVLAVVPKWFERGVKEAVYIRAIKPSLNRDTG